MRKPPHRNPDVHSEWLSQLDVDGPFLAYPVVKDMWPSGVDRLGDSDDRLLIFKQSFVQWQRAFDSYVEQPKTPESKAGYDAVRRAWIDVVLDGLAEWADLRADADVTVRSPGEQITVTASGALRGREDDPAALLLICEPTSGLRDAGLDGWAANDVDRLAMLLRKAQVEVGIVTDGQWWAVVWAKDGKPTGSGMVNALTWAEEPLLRDAFFTLVNQRRFRAVDAEQRLPRLFERSELEAEEITEALGTQVRRSVELLVQAFSEARLAAAKAGDPDPLTQEPDDVYQAAVTVMMRIVFLLFAEERDMLPTEQLYWDSYAIKDLLDDLRGQAAAGEEHLDESYDAWHRLLAVSQALHGGVNYDEMRMPAYGGSLLDSDRFPWLHAADGRGLRLKVSDRVMLHVLESVQTVVANSERRRISFREIDVEQIGYIYEGLLGYSCAEVTDDIILGLVGKDGEEPEIPLATINDLYDDHGGDPKKFAAALVAWVKDHQPAATSKTAAALAKLIDKEPAGDERAELVRLLTAVAAGDRELLETLVSWGNLIRRDLRSIPLVIPVGGLVVVETPSRRNAGAHYTPRSLAEEVVLHALQPLVYEPGPLQTSDENEWRLKSASAILALKVADIAAGSGAFLVAAARYLSERLVEAWVSEGMLDEAASTAPEDLRRRALREVIARCLYGADINPMAVEMCKLSLWLVSMDKTKPFSFVDDKIFCGNALLGLTNLEQLRYLHLYPNPATMDRQIFVDIDERIATATRLRHELASPVDERDPMRSTRGKLRLLRQVREATDELRLIADGIVAAGLQLGGKPGRPLDDCYKVLAWQLHEAFPRDGSEGDGTKLRERIDYGLTPTVETDYARWRTIHWVVEAPDVMVEHGGFDALIGNPPFLGGHKVAATLGDNGRDYVVNTLVDGARGLADICVYFIARDLQLCAPTGEVASLATNTLAQGDSREVGLDRAVAAGIQIRRAVQSRRWPAHGATVDFSAVWLSKARLGPTAIRSADGLPAKAISTLLEPVGRVEGRPYRLAENQNIVFIGSYVLGKGFVLTGEEAQAMIRDDSRNSEVVLPYVGGDDVSNRPDSSPSRWVINFRNMTVEEASTYKLPFRRVEQLVRPERAKLIGRNATGTDRGRNWWKYGRRADRLYRAIAKLDHVLTITLTSNALAPVRVPTGPVFDQTAPVFADSSYALLAVLSSNVHRSWVIQNGSTFGAGARYSLGEGFETFARPTPTVRLEEIGKILDTQRREMMLRRQLGLTALYGFVNDADVHGDADIDRMRAIHVELDMATTAAYGWEDVPLDHGFHTYRQMERWTVSPAARVEILDRLLELNHERARAEGQIVPDQNSSHGEDTLFA
jgi:hypothetical protein